MSTRIALELEADAEQPRNTTTNPKDAQPRPGIQAREFWSIALTSQLKGSLNRTPPSSHLLFTEPRSVCDASSSR